MGERPTFLNGMAIACVAVTGIFEAVQQGLRDSPSVRALVQIDLSGAWNYLPLLLLSAGAGAWAVQQFFRPSRSMLEPIALIQKARADLHERREPATREPEEPEKPERRAFLDPHITPRYLNDLVKGKIAVEARNILRPYLDKWIKTSGKVLNLTYIEKNNAYIAVLDLYSAESGAIYDQHVVSITLVRDQMERAETLRMGDIVAFSAKIYWDNYGWSLNEAEVLFISPSPPASPEALSPPSPASP